MNITSITSAGDVDGGAGGPEHVTVYAGATITATFTYNSTNSNPGIETTGKFDVLGVTADSFHNLSDGSSQVAMLSINVPLGTFAGTYNARVQVRNSSGPGAPIATDVANSAVVVIDVIDTTTSISAPDITYGEDGLVTVSVDPSAAPGSVSLIVDSNPAISLALSGGSAIFNVGVLGAGDHSLSATYTSTSGGYANDGPVYGTLHVAKANAAISVSGYSGTYDGYAHGASGSATGVLGEDLTGLLDLGASFTNVPGGTAHWVFAGDTNYNADEGDVGIVISKADATINVSGYSGTYDGYAHGASGSATGVLGEALSGLDLGASFTNVPGGTAHWTFTDVTGNYNDDEGDVSIVITKADATINVSGYSGTYDGNAHGASGSATGVLGEALSGLDLGASFTNVPGGTAHWTFTDVTGNYNDDEGDVAIVILAKAISVDGSTQASINISKAGVLSFTLANASGFVGSDTVALFNGATFHLKVGVTDYSVSSTAAVIDGKIVVSWRMSLELQNDLLALLGSGTPSAKTLINFVVSGTSNDGNYAISEDVMSRLFLQGKLTF